MSRIAEQGIDTCTERVRVRLLHAAGHVPLWRVFRRRPSSRCSLRPSACPLHMILALGNLQQRTTFCYLFCSKNRTKGRKRLKVTGGVLLRTLPSTMLFLGATPPWEGSIRNIPHTAYLAQSRPQLTRAFRQCRAVINDLPNKLLRDLLVPYLMNVCQIFPVMN